MPPTQIQGGSGLAFRRGGHLCCAAPLAPLERPLQLQPGVADVAKAALGVLGQATLEQVDDARRRPWWEEREIGFSIECRGDGVRLRVALECRLTGQAFVEHAAEREYVRPSIHMRAAGLLGAHVAGGSQGDAGTCHGRLDGRGGTVHDLVGAP